MAHYLKGQRLLAYCLTTCLSWSFVSTRSCTLYWVTKILMLAISNVHTGCICPTGRRFPNPVLYGRNFKYPDCSKQCWEFATGSPQNRKSATAEQTFSLRICDTQIQCLRLALCVRNFHFCAQSATANYKNVQGTISESIPLNQSQRSSSLLCFPCTCKQSAFLRICFCSLHAY